MNPENISALKQTVASFVEQAVAPVMDELEAAGGSAGEEGSEAC